MRVGIDVISGWCSCVCILYAFIVHGDVDVMCVCVGMSSSVTSMYGVTELAIGFGAMDDQSSSYDRLMLKSRRLRGVLGDEDTLR